MFSGKAENILKYARIFIVWSFIITSLGEMKNKRKCTFWRWGRCYRCYLSVYEIPLSLSSKLRPWSLLEETLIWTHHWQKDNTRKQYWVILCNYVSLAVVVMSSCMLSCLMSWITQCIENPYHVAWLVYIVISSLWPGLCTWSYVVVVFT